MLGTGHRPLPQHVALLALRARGEEAQLGDEVDGKAARRNPVSLYL